MNPIRVLMVDDHTLVRAGISALLRNLPGIQIVAEAGDGLEGLEAIKTHRPDVVLLDIALPKLSGLEIAARVHKQFPTVHVIILSIHKNEEFVWRALRAGADGYVVKDASLAELEIAIRSVIKGESYLSPVVSRLVVKDYIMRVEGSSELDKLTSRQREVLQLIAEGYSTKEAAHTLNLSVKTVESHRTDLMERLDIHDLAGLVRYAIQVGLVDLEG